MKQKDSPYYHADIETMSADAIIDMQLRKLQKQLEYNVTHALFYKELFAKLGADVSDINSLEALSKLPFIEKTHLRDNQKQHPPLGHHAGAKMDDIIRIHASSGTTGTPSFIGLTAYDKKFWQEAIARSYWAQGLRPNDIFAMGMSIGFFVGGLPVAGAVEEIGATLLPIGVGASERLIASITSMHANVLATTPSYAIYLAEIVNKSDTLNARDLGIKKVMVGAEPGGGVPEIRNHIQNLWNAKCFESVGNADVITIHSAECEAQDGCHFMLPDYVIMEIINPETGDIVSQNQPEFEGEMVFTHIDRECNPLLRFRTRDHVVIKTTPCPCGRTGPRIKCIGRTDDMLIIRGVNVWPSAIKDVIMQMRPEVSGELAIMVTETLPKVTPPLHIKVELAQNGVASADLAKKIETELRAKLIFAAYVELVPFQSLPRTEMKAKLIHHINKG